MESIIDKNSNTNKFKIMLNSELRKCIDTVFLQQEVLNDNAIEIFLTEIGVETGKQEKTYAQAMARKAINFYTPGELKKRFDYDGPGHTRTDLNKIYLSYLVKACNINWFTALGSIQDDQLWYVFFPETVHTCRAVKDLPPLIGEDVGQAASIRRRQVNELFILGDLFNKLLSGPSFCFIDEHSTSDIPKNAEELFGDAIEYIYKTIDTISKCADAKEWLTKKSIMYNVDWLKEEMNLGFFNPAHIQFTKNGRHSMYEHRQQLFELTFSL